MRFLAAQRVVAERAVPVERLRLGLGLDDRLAQLLQREVEHLHAAGDGHHDADEDGGLGLLADGDAREEGRSESRDDDEQHLEFLVHENLRWRGRVHRPLRCGLDVRRFREVLDAVDAGELLRRDECRLHGLELREEGLAAHGAGRGVAGVGGLAAHAARGVRLTARLDEGRQHLLAQLSLLELSHVRHLSLQGSRFSRCMYLIHPKNTLTEDNPRF
jgi:hypothetical protein